MKEYILLVFFLFLALAGCKKTKVAKSTPSCIKSEINDFEKNACDKGANVKRYSYQSKDVYVFDPGTCGADMTSEVLDENCKTLGYLGGITGNNTVNGDNFSDAIFKEDIWKK